MNFYDGNYSQNQCLKFFAHFRNTLYMDVHCTIKNQTSKIEQFKIFTREQQHGHRETTEVIIKGNKNFNKCL